MAERIDLKEENHGRLNTPQLVSDDKGVAQDVERYLLWLITRSELFVRDMKQPQRDASEILDLSLGLRESKDKLLASELTKRSCLPIAGACWYRLPAVVRAHREKRATAPKIRAKNKPRTAAQKKAFRAKVQAAALEKRQNEVLKEEMAAESRRLFENRVRRGVHTLPEDFDESDAPHLIRAVDVLIVELAVVWKEGTAEEFNGVYEWAMKSAEVQLAVGRTDRQLVATASLAVLQTYFLGVSCGNEHTLMNELRLFKYRVAREFRHLYNWRNRKFPPVLLEELPLFFGVEPNSLDFTLSRQTIDFTNKFLSEFSVILSCRELALDIPQLVETILQWIQIPAAWASDEIEAIKTEILERLRAVAFGSLDSHEMYEQVLEIVLGASSIELHNGIRMDMQAVLQKLPIDCDEMTFVYNVLGNDYAIDVRLRITLRTKAGCRALRNGN